jgi:hypothetical protein
MATTDAIAICSQALLLVGESSIDSFEGDTVAHEVANARYAAIRDLMLGDHPWRFNRRFDVLNRLSAAPPAATGYAAAYQLPIPCYRIVAPFVAGTRVTSWQVGSGHLWIDAMSSEEVALEYHGLADETLWTPAFRQAVVYRLAADFAVPVREDQAMQRGYLEVAAAQLTRAKHGNATEQPQPGLRLTRFAAARAR